jgi:oligosaccharyl transferase (archaeosortase A-associated)
MKEKNYSRLAIGILLFIFFCVALYLRIAIPYEQVFRGDFIKFVGFDSWNYVRLVDNIVHHYPQNILFDPYTLFPTGMYVFWHPFYVWFLGGISLLLGLGAPTETTINFVCVYTPAVLGALAIIPVFYLGKVLFNRWVGVIAAGLITVSSSEFLGRSILGFVDHHIAEVLWSTLALMFLALALKTGREKDITFGLFYRRGWAELRGPVIYSVLAGVFLGIYLLTWVGGLLFLFIFAVYFLVQFIVDHVEKRPTDYLGITGVLFFGSAFVISIPLLTWSHYGLLYRLSLPVSVLIPAVLACLSWIIARRQYRVWFYPLSILVLGILAITGLYLINSELLLNVVDELGILNPAGTTSTVVEMQPLLFPFGEFSLDPGLYNFTTGLFLSFISLIVLIYAVVKNDTPEKILLVVWSILILLALLGQRRFAYYFAVNVALLSAYLSWLVLKYFGFKESETGALKLIKERNAKSKKTRKSKVRAHRNIPKMVVGVVIIFAIAFYPNIGPLPGMGPWEAGAMPVVDTASHGTFISDAWYRALAWLKGNSPEPFGDANFYYAYYEPPAEGTSYDYPDTAYGIMAWWDYGHAITRIAHRIPVSNPHLIGIKLSARFFTSQDTGSADEVLDELGIRYILVDNKTALTKFHGSIIGYTDKRPEDFFELYYSRQTRGALRGDYYFYPEYYRSFAARLYNFDGQEVIPVQTLVVQYEEKVFPEGDTYKEIINIQPFMNYDEALNFIAQRGSENYRIVGQSPFVSPVPLEALDNYTLIYSSDELVKVDSTESVPEVKIFEYRK